MKYLLMLALLVPFWCGLPAQARTLADALLELYADPNPEISAGAMLLTSCVYDNEPLLTYIKKHPRETDPPYARIIRVFLLAKWDHHNKNAQLEFIRQFPATQDALGELIGFEEKVCAAVKSPVIKWLFHLAYSQDTEVRRKAREKIHQARPFADGWVSHQFMEADALQ